MAARSSATAAVPPYLYKSDDNPNGGLDDATTAGLEAQVKNDQLALLDQFCTNFFNGPELKVSEWQHEYARDIAAFASSKGTLDCIAAFARTAFRGDLEKVSVPMLMIHGDSNAIVPFEVSGKRSALSIAGSELVVVKDAPHGFNASHAGGFNGALLNFLAR